MARITEGWGGNRVWDGSQWMELYYSMDAELYGTTLVLTSKGKIPNGNSSVLARLKVAARFDDNTLDNSNSFKVSGSWPAFNGSVSIPTVLEQTIYNNTIWVYPAFGSATNLRAVASLSGVDRVPGTTWFDRWIAMPARAWAKPTVPTVTGYSLNAAGDTATVTISGNRTNAGLDQYWQTLDNRIHHSSTGWVDSFGHSGGRTSFSFSSLVANRRYQAEFRTWNEDGGVSAWSPILNVYTKPNAPTITQVKRKTTDLTKVDVAWAVTAAFPGRHYIERRMTPADSWMDLADVDPSVSTYTDAVATGTQPQYRVRTISYDSKIYSGYSAIGTSDIGSVKEFIPGVKEIYLGTTKITKVYTDNKEIWFSG